jgi:hypothetical protein
VSDDANLWRRHESLVCAPASFAHFYERPADAWLSSPDRRLTELVKGDVCLPFTTAPGTPRPSREPNRLEEEFGFFFECDRIFSFHFIFHP